MAIGTKRFYVAPAAFPSHTQIIFNLSLMIVSVEHLCSFSSTHPNNIQFITHGGGGLPPQSNVKSKSVNVTIYITYDYGGIQGDEKKV